MAKILLVEDDHDLAKTVIDGLKAERHVVEAVSDGNAAADFLKVREYDVIILDWELPGKSGIELLSVYRTNGGKTPVIMLTGKSTYNNKETGFTSGADDYLTKPFDLRELNLRVNALLRRGSMASSELLRVGEIEMDPMKYSVKVQGKDVHLSQVDFSLLEFLMRHPGQVFSTEALLSRVWHYDSNASPEGLRAAVRRIRKAVDVVDDPRKSIIQNVARVGYRLRTD